MSRRKMQGETGVSESVFDETLRVLNEARAKSDSCLVSFSGGKDSIVVLDLCLRVFDHVEAFFMYTVPGMPLEEERVVVPCMERNVKLHQFPHWGMFSVLQSGTYCFNPPETDYWPKITLRDIYKLAMAESGITMIATGAKRADSVWRRRNLNHTAKWGEVFNPIIAWTEHEVTAFLLARGIKPPVGDVDLSPQAVFWLHDNRPEDYKILEHHFPFIGAVIKRREINPAWAATIKQRSKWKTAEKQEPTTKKQAKTG